MRKKEFGSEFHFCDKDFILKKQEKVFFDDKSFSYFLSGRSSLYALLKQGIKELGWKKVYVPSYYCQDVIENLPELGIEVITFNFNPQKTLLDIDFFEDDKSSVFINVNYFGIVMPNIGLFKSMTIVDDLTHDLLSIKESSSDYVFASLRKQLPIPLGGVLYSPKKYKLPTGIECVKGGETAEYKTLGMFLKREYLENRFHNKDLFRNHYEKAEKQLTSLYKDFALPVLVKNILDGLAFERIIKKKESNIKLCSKQLKDFNDFLVSSNEKALGILLLFNSSSERDFVRNKLIEVNVYPAILWPNQKTELDINYQNRFLFLHVDFRYSEEDIIYITTELKKSILECQKQEL